MRRSFGAVVFVVLALVQSSSHAVFGRVVKKQDLRRDPRLLAETPVGTVVVNGHGPCGIVAGRDASVRFVLGNLSLLDITGGTRHISGTQVSFENMTRMATDAGVRLEKVTPRDAAFVYRPLSHPVPIPERIGVKGVCVSPFLSRSQIGKRLAFLSKWDLRESAVHFVEPLVTHWFPAWLQARNVQHSMGYHSQYNAFARKASDPIVVNTIDLVDKIGPALARLKLCNGHDGGGPGKAQKLPQNGHQGFFDKLYYDLVRRTFQTAARVLTRSPAMVEILAKQGLGKDRLHLWPGGVHVHDWSSLPASGNLSKNHDVIYKAIAETHGDHLVELIKKRTGGRPTFLVNWGRLAAEKRVDWVVELQRREYVDQMAQAAGLESADFHPVLLIIGDGPGAVERKLWRHNAALGGKAVFMGRRVGKRRDEILMNSDVGVLAQDPANETFGLVYAEGPAAGLPLAACPGDQASYVAGGGVAQADNHTVAGLARAVGEALNLDPAAGWNHVKARFPIEESFKHFLEGLVPAQGSKTGEGPRFD